MSNIEILKCSLVEFANRQNHIWVDTCCYGQEKQGNGHIMSYESFQFATVGQHLLQMTT